MEEVNFLGPAGEIVDRIVTEGMTRNLTMQEISKQLAIAVAQYCPKWNWTVLCGDNFDLSSEGRKHRDVMLHRRYFNALRVLIFRGSPLEKYVGGPAYLAIVRNKLPNPASDADRIRTIVERWGPVPNRLVEQIRQTLRELYPRDNWIVIVGDDFALSQDYEQVPSLKFCATVGHISIVIVKAYPLT